MNPIQVKVFNKIVKDQESYIFDFPRDGLCLISVIARCKSWLQNFKRLFNDDDLAIEIDNFPLYEFKGKRKEFASPGSWNGNELKDTRKTCYFVVPFRKGVHEIKFIVDGTPFLEKVEIYELNLDNSNTLTIKESFFPKPERDKLFFDVVIKNRELESFYISARANGEDKLQLKIDGSIEENSTSKKYKPGNRFVFRRLHAAQNRIWYWLGSQLRGGKKDLEKSIISSENLLHSLEFKGKGNPIIETISLSFRGFSSNKFGKVVLYDDITTESLVYLRSEPNNERDDTIIAELKNGAVVEILEEVVTGKWIEAKSYIWHKVRYQRKEGYILSSFIEIDGQERERIIEIIRRKSKEEGVDDAILIALAGCESRFKVYATSRPYNPKSLKIGQGIFQLTNELIVDLNNPTKPFYSPVSYSFDVNQNIAAGIKYFTWLYQQRYVKRKDKLQRSIAAYNAGPASVPVNGRFYLEEYEAQTKNLVACVLKNYKRSNFQSILWSILLLVFIPVSIFWYLYATDHFYSNMLRERYLLAQVGHFPYAIWDEGSDTILFLNSKKEIVKKISAGRLTIDDIFHTPEDIKKWRSIFIEEVNEVPNNIFYFLASTTWTCGAQNCTHALFKFDAKHDQLTNIKNDVFGSSVDLLLSPDQSKMAIVSFHHASVCEEMARIEVVDLESFTYQFIDGLGDSEYPVVFVKSLSWKNDNEIELFITQHNCSHLGKGIWDKVFEYNLNSKELRLLKKEFRSESRG